MTTMTDFMENFIVNPESTYDQSSMTGSGMYSSVFDSDMPNMVVKHSARTFRSSNCFTDGWLIWAILCMNRNMKYGSGWSFMPVIHGLIINYETGEFHAVIERLKEVRKPTHHRGRGKPNFTGYMDDVLSSDIDKWNKPFWDGKIPYKKAIKKAFLEIVSIFRETKATNTPIFIDAHDANWMWRETPSGRHSMVLTDPFTVSYDFMSADGALSYNQMLVDVAQGNPNIKIIGQPKK